MPERLSDIRPRQVASLATPVTRNSLSHLSRPHNRFSECPLTVDGALDGMVLCRYPLGDAGLQLVYDVIGVLTTVHRWAFSTRGWHLRLQAPAAPAPAMGFDYGADLPGGPA